MHGMIKILIGEYEEDIKEAEKDEYKDELPPSLVPKCRIEMAGLKQSMAGLDLTLEDGWQGDVKEELKKANECFKAAEKFYSKFSKKLLAAAKELGVEPSQPRAGTRGVKREKMT